MTERLGRLRLCAITGGLAEGGFSKVRAALAAGVRAVQLREKDLSDRELLRWAHALRKLTGAFDALLIVNDRPDIARLCSADGVHVGQDDLPVDAVRRIAGDEVLVGVSCGNLAEAVQAAEDGASYVGLGSVFATSTKPDAGPPIGLSPLFEVAASCPVPVVAIGGMRPERAGEVAATGVFGLAASSALWKAQDLEQAVSAFLAPWPSS